MLIALSLHGRQPGVKQCSQVRFLDCTSFVSDDSAEQSYLPSRGSAYEIRCESAITYFTIWTGSISGTIWCMYTQAHLTTPELRNSQSP